MTRDAVVIELVADREGVAAALEIANASAAIASANFATEPETLESWVQAWEEKRTTHPWAVARDGDRVLGFAKSGPHNPRGGYLWTAELAVYVVPEAHGLRIGTRLYGFLIPLMERQGYATLIARVALPNPASMRLHEAAGFRPFGTFHRAGHKLGRWHDVAFLELHLRAAAQDPPAPLRTVAEAMARSSS